MQYLILIFCFLFGLSAQIPDVEKYAHRHAKITGTQFEGITQRFKKSAVFLTFDLCKTGFDQRIIDFLVENKIPASFFMTAIWIEKQPVWAKKIAENPLFDIQNHGAKHLPCFVEKSSVYGIKSTENVQEIIEEVEKGNQVIFDLTNKKTRFYRSGTAHYDDICVEIARDLGYEIAGFAVNGDAGATYASQQVYTAILQARAGDIILLHANKPQSGTYEGLIKAVRDLQKKEVKFEKLSSF